MKKVKEQRRARTRISSKNQATIPVEALRRSGLKPGDELGVAVEGPGELVLERADDVIARHAGSLPDVYPPGTLDDLREEWV